jgi:calcineurin-like phosphoesterase family protein
MNYWILTDTHFGHEKMQDYCGRPVGFEERILKNVSRMVNVDDVLIHLGDFCVYRDEDWHKRFMDVCKARKWLVRGNHDRKSLGWYFSHGWGCVADEIKVVVFGKTILLSHKPVLEGNFDINVHGHQHNTVHHPENEMGSKNRLVFIEHEYMPVNLRRIIER